MTQDGRLGTDGDIEEAVDRDKQRQRLERDIVALEKKLLREKQFNKQVVLNSELKQLKKDLEELKWVMDSSLTRQICPK